jgi:hypothetical protein
MGKFPTSPVIVCITTFSASSPRICFFNRRCRTSDSSMGPDGFYSVVATVLLSWLLLFAIPSDT